LSGKNAGNEHNGSPEGRVVGGIAEFGNDIATLVELQSKLVLIDLKECLGRALVPLGLIVAGLFVGLGTLPVILLGVADVLARALSLKAGEAMLVTGGAVLVLSVAVIVIASFKIGPSLASFNRSREELGRNLAWIRTVLLYSGRSVPKRRF